MNRKELTKTFIMISKWKNPLVAIVQTKIIQRCKGWDVFLAPQRCREITKSRQLYLMTINVLWSQWPAPMAHSYRLGPVTWRYQVRIPIGPDICHRGCAYTVLQTVQMPVVYCEGNGTMHYREPLKSLGIRLRHSPGFGLPSVAILPWFYRKRRKAIFTHMITADENIHIGKKQGLVITGNITHRQHLVFRLLTPALIRAIFPVYVAPFCQSQLYIKLSF